MAEEWHIPPWQVERDCSARWFHWWAARRSILGQIAEKERKKQERKRRFE